MVAIKTDCPDSWSDSDLEANRSSLGSMYSFGGVSVLYALGGVDGGICSGVGN